MSDLLSYSASSTPVSPSSVSSDSERINPLHSSSADHTDKTASPEPTLQQKIHSTMQAWGLPTWMIQLFLFGLIGASGIVVDLMVAVFCREVFDIGVQYGIYPAFVVAVTWNFELNRRITFDSRHLSWWYAYSTFFLACTVGLLVRLGFIYLAIHQFKLDDRFLTIGSTTIPYLRLSYIAYVGGIVLAYVINFLGSKFIAFRSPR